MRLAQNFTARIASFNSSSSRGRKAIPTAMAADLSLFVLWRSSLKDSKIFMEMPVITPAPSPDVVRTVCAPMFHAVPGRQRLRQNRVTRNVLRTRNEPHTTCISLLYQCSGNVLCRGINTQSQSSYTSMASGVPGHSIHGTDTGRTESKHTWKALTHSLNHLYLPVQAHQSHPRRFDVGSSAHTSLRATSNYGDLRDSGRRLRDTSSLKWSFGASVGTNMACCEYFNYRTVGLRGVGVGDD